MAANISGKERTMRLLPVMIGLLVVLPATMSYAGREKAGTEDINIGVGELQEDTGGSTPAGARITTDDGDGTKAPILVPGVQKPRRGCGDEESEKGGKVETEWKIEKGEK